MSLDMFHKFSTKNVSQIHILPCPPERFSNLGLGLGLGFVLRLGLRLGLVLGVRVRV